MINLSNQPKVKIYISTDHSGFELKNLLVDSLKNLGHEIADYGSFEYNSTDDYTDFVVPMAMNMQKDLQNNKDVKGIVICRNGVGVSMAANKFKGIRAGLSFSVRHVISAIKDDNINVLALPIDYVSKDEAVNIVNEFLNYEFPAEDRHVKRLNKIKDLGM